MITGFAFLFSIASKKWKWVVYLSLSMRNEKFTFHFSFQVKNDTISRKKCQLYSMYRFGSNLWLGYWTKMEYEHPFSIYTLAVKMRIIVHFYFFICACIFAVFFVTLCP